MNIKEQQTEDLLREFGVHFSKTKLGFRIPPYWPDCHEPHMEYAVRFERLKPRMRTIGRVHRPMVRILEGTDKMHGV